MPFFVQELAFTLSSGSEKRWVAVVGCGPQSVQAQGCGTGTQPVVARLDPIDFTHGLKSKNDFIALKQALGQMLVLVDQQVDQMQADEGKEENPGGS